MTNIALSVGNPIESNILTPKSIFSIVLSGFRSKFGLKHFATNERQACATVGLRRSVYRYQPELSRDEQIIELLLELAHQKPELGFKKLFELLRRRGHQWNHKRVHRLSC